MDTGKIVAQLCGVALIVLGVVLLASGGVSLPTRTPSVSFRFGGFALLLLALAPALAGGAILGLARGRLARDSGWTRGLLFAAMAAVALAFVIAPKI